jgi:uncharacterized protein (DUF488 family)
MTKRASTMEPMTIWTIGHSTRPLAEFLDLLAEYRIQTIADVRSFPASRKYPQYGKQALAESLDAQSIGYRWLPALGGRRRAAPDSPNIAWRNASFRGYADYMASAGFAQGLDELLQLAQQSRTALMCAEAVWWRCHRSMIADALCARGVRVVHILDAGHSAAHPMTAPARIVDGKLTYATAAGQELHLP